MGMSSTPNSPDPFAAADSGASRIPCLTCTGFCCRRFRVYLFPEDIVCLNQGTGLRPEAFCLPVPLTSRNSDHAHFSFSLGAEERFLLGLKRNAGGCRFRIRGNHQLGCGIHAFRPLICRSYPFAVSGRTLRLIPENVCPTPWRLDADTRQAWLKLGRELSTAALRFQGFLETWHEANLPALAAGAAAIPLKDFRRRFRFFLDRVVTAP
jgi:Fe-S-cluster containining protein